MRSKRMLGLWVADKRMYQCTVGNKRHIKKSGPTQFSIKCHVIWGSLLSNVRFSPSNCQIEKSLLIFFLANIGLYAFIWTQWTILIHKSWSSIHFHQKILIHSVINGEPTYLFFDGQKSNLLSHQSNIIYTDLLEVCN